VWYPDKSKATEKDPPLYLHISAATQDVLNKAIEKVNELINTEMGSLLEDRKKDDRGRERVGPTFLLFFAEWSTDSRRRVEKMARGEDSSGTRDVAEFQCPSKGCWTNGKSLGRSLPPCS